MRLALLVEYYPPSRASAAVQMSELARAFARQGHEITVFTTSAEVPDAELAHEEPRVQVLRVATGKVKGIGLARRAMSEISMSLQLWRGTRKRRLHVADFHGIIWYSPTIFLAPFVAWLKSRSGAPAYLILRDIFPQWALDAGVLRRGPAYYFFRLAERFQYSVADVVGAQSPANVVHVRRDTRDARPVEVLFNWVELGRPEPAPSDIPARYSISGKRILVYGGNMGVAQDMDNLVRLAERLRESQSIHLLLVGAGSEVERLRVAVADRRLTNVTFVGEVDPEQFRAILRSCHVGLITLDRRLTTHNIPGKLLAYLEAGLPVIASVNAGNDLLEILHESGAGIGFVNGDDVAFAQGARGLVLDAARCAAMSQKARVLASERFSIESITRQLMAALQPGAGLQPSSDPA